MALPISGPADVIDYFAIPGGVPLERRGPGTVNAYGENVPGAITTIVLDPCAIVPLTGRALERAQTDRGREVVEVYAREALYAGDATRSPDVVTWSGRRWALTTVQDYGVQGGAWIANAELAEAVP